MYDFLFCLLFSLQRKKYGGQGWIRTTVVSRRQIYSLLPLATRAPTHINFSKMPLTGFEPVTSPLPRECATPAPQRLIATRALEKPAIGIEPTTYGLQNRCSTVELCRRHMFILLRKNLNVKPFLV